MRMVCIMTITSKEIALIAGVSQSTVSRSLNDSPLISEKTKERIRKVAKEQGFVFNANARSLSTNKTNTVGIIYPDNFNDFSVNLYFSSLHNQLRESLEKENLDLIVSFAENKFTKTNNIERLIKCQKVDGLIIVKSKLDHQTVNYLKSSKIPFVFMHHIPDISQLHNVDVDIVCTDHIKGGYLATEPISY
jgi:LacI family transcriptional regulator